MLNPFKKAEAPKAENIEELPIEQPEDLEIKENLVDSESIDVRLEALTDYFNQCEKNGIEMTREMVETEIRERLGLEIEDLLGEKITDPELKLTHEEIVSRIKEVMNQKAEEKGTPLSYLRGMFKSQFARFAVVTALMILKFGINPTYAAEHKDTKENIKDKIEHETKKPVSHEGDGDKTFKATIENFNGKILISATNSFETDKADLKDDGKLSAEFDKFLSSIDKTNFNSLINQDWAIKGSSDERKTSWAGGNMGLTHDRIEVVKLFLLEILAHHNFGDKLSSEQIKQLMEKKINEVYPTGGAEKGVTYLTDLVNPVSGHNYTEAEIKNVKDTNPSEYHKMLDKCRYTNFELSASKTAPVVTEKIEPIKKPIDQKVDNQKNKIPEIPKIITGDNFDKYYFLVDNSASMGGTKKNMAKELSSLNINKPFMMANYSDKLSGIKSEKSSQELAEKMTIMDTEHASDTELTFSSAIKFLEKIEKQEHKQIQNNEQLPKGIMYIATDETLQDVNHIDQLKTLSAKTNTQVEVLVFYDRGHKFLRLSLDDIQKQIDANNFSKIHDYDNSGKLLDERWIIKKLADESGKIVIGR